MDNKTVGKWDDRNAGEPERINPDELIGTVFDFFCSILSLPAKSSHSRRRRARVLEGMSDEQYRFNFRRCSHFQIQEGRRLTECGNFAPTSIPIMTKSFRRFEA